MEALRRRCAYVSGSNRTGTGRLTVTGRRRAGVTAALDRVDGLAAASGRAATRGRWNSCVPT